MKILAFVAFFLAFAPKLFSQEEDESCLPPSKKVLKLIETAVNVSDAKTAVDNFNAAISAAPDNATAYYEYAMYAYETGVNYYDRSPNPALGDKSFVKAEEMFKKALEMCSNYHANCSYYLGVINYSQKDMDEAVKWFTLFKEFKNDDNMRYPQDYTKKLADVNEVLKDQQAEEDMLSSAVPFAPQEVKNVSSAKDEYFPMI